MITEGLLLGGSIGLMGAIMGTLLHRFIVYLPQYDGLEGVRRVFTDCSSRGWVQMIPLLSYIVPSFNRGHSDDTSGYRRFIVECLSILLWLYVVFAFGLTVKAFWLIFFFSALLVVFFTDLEHHIIPNTVTYPLFFLGLFMGWFEGRLMDSVYGVVACFGVYFLISVIGRWYYKKEVVGAGDIKLITAIAAYWGLKLGVMVLYFSFLVGGVIGGILLLMKQRPRQDFIPFGPMICIGVLGSLKWGHYVWGILTTL